MKTKPLRFSGATISANSDGNVITAQQISDWAFNASGSLSIYDAVRGAAVLNSGTTFAYLWLTAQPAMFLQSAGKGGSGFPTSVALFGAGIADATNANVWGLNTVLSDNRGQTISSGTGRQLNNELDFNVTSPNTAVLGLVLQGASLSVPAISNGFVVGPLALQQYAVNDYSTQWTAAFQVDDNVTSLAFDIGVGGASRAGGSGSAVVQMNYMNPGAVEKFLRFQALPVAGEGGANAALYISNADGAAITNIGTAQGGFFTQDNASVTNGLVIGKHGTTGANIPSQDLIFGYNDGGSASQNYSIFVDSAQAMQFNSTAGGTSGKFNFAGTIYVQSTPGVNCPAGVTAGTVVVLGGVVTHC